MATPLSKALGQRIRELRTERGFSQEAFADHCGVHRTFMGTIERGETNMSFQNLEKMAVAFKITLSQMLEGLEKTAPAPKKPRGHPRKAPA
jgi:transcriptional regulator with XRE-family HTH domain